ncbi:membrane protein of unknown function [uncultured Sphingopyxis sp.]|uniref:Oligosaccharide repeat unit polymerase n=2 Tax=uncultured Sphingopyxis sp. TaxID=310581 RepID=A0A1Y5PVW6_9SPHN|nr:membrane protein of unknown function [uncultured Sphingopyxis sp.]
MAAPKMNGAFGGEDAHQDRKGWMIFLYILLFGLYIASYRYYLAPYWGYMGFVDAFNPYKLMTSLAVIASFAWFTPRTFSVRAFFLNLSLTVYLLPSLAIYTYADRPTSALLIITLAFAVVYATSAISIPRFSLATVPAKPLMWLLAALTVWLLVFSYVFGGFQNFNLDITRVYEFRREAAEDLPGVFGYLISVFSKVIIPVGVILSLRYRIYIFTGIFFFMTVMLFGFTSHKSILFGPFVVTGLYIFLSRYNRYSVILYVLIIMLTFGVIGEIYLGATGSGGGLGWYNTLLIRRVLMVPSLLDYYYLEFFSGSPKYYWSSSFITFGLVPDYYGIPAPKIIGEVYFFDADMSANTGFIGSGFSQAGLVGVIAYALGVGTIFAIFQSYGRYLGPSFVAPAMMGQVLTMVRSSDFLTTFLTHGLLVSLVLLVIISSPEESGKKVQAQSSGSQPLPDSA